MKLPSLNSLAAHSLDRAHGPPAPASPGGTSSTNPEGSQGRTHTERTEAQPLRPLLPASAVTQTQEQRIRAELSLAWGQTRLPAAGLPAPQSPRRPGRFPHVSQARVSCRENHRPASCLENPHGACGAHPDSHPTPPTVSRVCA